MALPFIAGLAVGAGVVVAISKSKTIKETASSLFNKSKNMASESIEKGKETVNDVKQTIDATAECIKEKKAQKALSQKTDNDTEE